MEMEACSVKRVLRSR